MTPSTRVFSPRQRDVLEALCRRVVPAAYGPEAGAVPDLVARVEERLAGADPELASRFAGLLSALDHPVVGPLLTGRPGRFSRRSAPARDARLRALEHSRIGVRRTVFQALRRLILSTYYAVPEAGRAIGYLGPLHTRDAAFPWEGPLPGVPAADEPVARGDGAVPSPPDDGVPAGVVQGRDLTGTVERRADVCVVGTGAGGAVAAARLAEAGFDVVMLEEGGYWTARDFTEDEAEMTTRLYAEAATRATDDLSFSLLQGRAVGGSTTVNWMIMLRTPDWVLGEWEEEHGLRGLGPAELAPVFQEVEEDVHAREVPDDAHAPNNRIILDGAARLGWSARPARINARGCVRSGFCGLGCRYGAKQGTRRTYVPRALAAGARLYSDVRVEGVEVVERGGRAPLKRVVGTVLDRETGRARGRLTVRAPIVVLAAGAVGTPAILQRSGMGGGGVGRYLRLHPTTAVVGRYDQPVYAAAGVPLSAYCDEFLRGSDGYGFWIECPPLLPALASVAVQGFGDEHRRVMEAFPDLGALIALVRDGAERGRSSGGVRVDRRGRTRIRYRLSGADRRNLVAAMTAAARLHFAAGAREVRTLHAPPRVLRSPADVERIEAAPVKPNRIALFSAHVNGTCRLGTDPGTSGCTPDGERHGVAGLYVADGSLLPTAPGVNPQETIMALATVVARRIAARHAGI